MNLFLKRERTILIILLFISIFFFHPSLCSAAFHKDNKKVSIVVLDAGHGGKDPGAVGKKVKEKDIALAITLKLGEYIEENLKDIKVIYTRKKDVFVPLYKRAEIANENDADLFISIHVNANDNKRAFGTSSHVLGLHRTDEHFEVAKRENSVILLEEDYSTKYEGFDPKSPESYIIFSLMQNLYLEQSINLAATVQKEFKEKGKRKNRGVIQQGLLVLARTSMPGVLIETGFLTNPTEEKYLMTDYGQSIIASAIFRAFRAYKNKIEEKSNFNTVNKGEENIENNIISEHSQSDQSNAESENGTQNNNENDVPLFPKSNQEKYYVQVLSSQSPISKDSEKLKKLPDIKIVQQGNYYKCLIGGKSNYQDIIRIKDSLKNIYPDAFIVTIKDEKVIPYNHIK